MAMFQFLALVLFYGILAGLALLVIASVMGHIRMALWRRKHRRIVSEQWRVDYIKERRPWF
jgi:hypothetical protein